MNFKRLVFSKFDFKKIFVSNMLFVSSYLVYQFSKNKLNLETLPTYTRKEVSLHYNKETRIWVMYKDGVYDITDFLDLHPGGESKILLAAGGSIEPFWAQYSFHLDSELVQQQLKKYRIGNLHKNDIMKQEDIPDFSFMKKHISRSEKLQNKHHSFPYCAEPNDEDLIEYFYTPSDLFFVRNHNSIPEKVNLEDYKLEIEYNGTIKTLLWKDLQALPKVKKSTIIACAGLKRKYMILDGKETKGIGWKGSAIGNAIWEGVYIKDILKFLGIKVNEESHIHAIGMDKDFQGEHYSASVPYQEAINQAIIATKYNGSDIPFDHGYPARFVIPGFIGVRNVKWVNKIKISPEESESAVQKKDYKIIPNGYDPLTLDVKNLKPVMTWEVNSAIMYPKENSVIKDDDLTIKGWAFGTNGNEIFSVELSFDEGKTWELVKKMKFDYNDDGKVFGWTKWDHTIDLRKIYSKKLNIWVRTKDLQGNEQPVDCSKIFNFRGIMNNSIHKVELTLI